MGCIHGYDFIYWNEMLHKNLIIMAIPLNDLLVLKIFPDNRKIAVVGDELDFE